MSELKYRWILYLIATVILATLIIQGYWTYKNYLSGKQQLMNDVQESLDTAVDKYYTLLAQRSAFSYISTNQRENFNFSFPDSLPGTQRVEAYSFTDSSRGKKKIQKNMVSGFFQYRTGVNASDSIKITADTLFLNRKPLEALTTKVMISFAQDSLSLKKIDSLVTTELRLKNINLKHTLHLKDTFSVSKESSEIAISNKKLSAHATSVYIPKGSTLVLEYNNITLLVLKNNLFGIFLSLLLLGSVIASLLYLFKIIKQQKQLSEMKNDLINNITHEFKTPIATIGVAMESITHFNKRKQDEKTNRYAEITSQQVKKLNLMVEKLLETASLDSEKLSLSFEETNVNDLIASCVQNVTLHVQKTIATHLSPETITYPLDRFHFENALNNILDNALKYGGDTIKVSLLKTYRFIEILVTDSGNSLTEDQKNLVFDKFYRVPKGNTHDVKGYGIGLYYAKKIVEKHKGSISVHLYKNETTFKISLPNE